jgi:lipopolysaccharide/colanic/teichoic acid biosynthesis glycosyltransferase
MYLRIQIIDNYPKNIKGGQDLERIRSLLQVKIEPLNYERYGKRCFDVCVSLFLLLIIFPLYPIIALLLLFSSGRPLLFTQTRTGQSNEPFQIIKFRTMKHNNIKVKKSQYEWYDCVPDDFIFKSAHNLEVTKIGMLLRRSSIDEIPQLFNVLRGEMSLIGPRPEVPEITRWYNEKQRKRLLLKPGLTGWAQVNGRADSCHGHKIEHDLFYIEHCSFKLDLKIFILTIVAIFKGKGAY